MKIQFGGFERPNPLWVRQCSNLI